MANSSNAGELDLLNVVPEPIANRLQLPAPPSPRPAATAPAPEPLLRWRLPASVRRHRSQPFASPRRARD